MLLSLLTDIKGLGGGKTIGTAVSIKGLNNFCKLPKEIILQQ